MALFGLIDGNNFYASCERLFRPDLINKPVVILSNNDGCVISRSNEAKAFIPMGAPIFQYKEVVKQQKITVFSSNFALYGDISARLMQLISLRVPRLEVYSIDEAFADFSRIPDPLKLGALIRQQALKGVGIPTCIGIASTKTLAKVANHLAKKNPHYQGICLLGAAPDIQAALKGLPVNEIWGVGRRLSARLREAGINTAYNLQQVDPRWMRQHFTVVGERLVQELNGISCLRLDEHVEAKKSIQVSRSFAKDIIDFEELRANVASYATRLGAKLREQGLKTATLILSIKTNRFKEGFYQQSVTINLPQAINDEANLIKACGKGLLQIYKPDLLYKKAGVMALDLIPLSQQQYSLFASDTLATAKTTKVSNAMDQLNAKYGTGTIHMAACGQQLSWKDRKDQKSPAYTTNWKELPIVYAK